MTKKLLTFLFGSFLIVSALAGTTEISQETLDSPDKISSVNENFNTLYTGKLDLRPGHILPKTGSRYNLGSSSYHWSTGYFDTLSVSTITATSATITNLSATSLTATTGTIANIVSSSVGTNQIAYSNGVKLVGSSNLTFDGTGVTASSISVTTLDVVISRYRRPTLVFIDTNTVDLENNTDTSNQTCVLFKDGGYRCVTENTASADKYRRFSATSTANFTSGTEDSGLRSTYVRTANTLYHLYAVKSLINASNFVMVGDTVTPTQANYSSLETAYGTNGWVYLGVVPNGDNSGSTNVITAFKQAGAITILNNTVTNNTPVNGAGLRLATTAGATTLTYSYSSGTSSAKIPPTATFAYYCAFVGSNGTAGSVTIADSGNSRNYGGGQGSARVVGCYWVVASEGVKISATASVNSDILLTGWVDGALADSATPMR